MDPRIPVERTAAHEAGHAITARVMGMEVAAVWIRADPTDDGKFGWTEELSDTWRGTCGLPVECQIIRLIIQKAGGLAGEAIAGVGGASTIGAEKDLGAIAAGLSQLGILHDGEVAPPSLWSVVVQEAARVLDAERAAFDALRKELLQNVGGEVRQLPGVISVRDEAHDRALLDELRLVAEKLRASGRIPRRDS